MKTIQKKPRGLRNNNPLNIRNSEYVWRGQCGYDDEGFCIFENRIYGYRAAFRILYTYRKKYHLTTIGEIIERWAPPSENDTRGYVQFVCDTLNTFQTRSFCVGHGGSIEKERCIDLLCAMAVMESGWSSEIKREEIEQGYNLAFPW